MSWSPAEVLYHLCSWGRLFTTIIVNRTKSTVLKGKSTMNRNGQYQVLHLTYDNDFWVLSPKLKCYWNIVLNIAHTMPPTMRINLQNIKENHEKIGYDTPPVTIFSSKFNNLPINGCNTPISCQIFTLQLKIGLRGSIKAYFSWFSFIFWRLIRMVGRIVCSMFITIFQ